MNKFGVYKMKEHKGSIKFEPIIFLASNWPLICKMGGLEEPVPQLQVFSGLGSDPTPGADTSSLIFNRESGKVIVNMDDLNVEAMAMSMQGGDVIGMTWGLMGAIVRGVFRRKNAIPAHEFLDMETLVALGYPDELIDVLKGCIGFPEGTPEYNERTDGLVGQSLVQIYFSSLSLEEDVDVEKVKTILQARKNTPLQDIVQFPQI